MILDALLETRSRLTVRGANIQRDATLKEVFGRRDTTSGVDVNADTALSLSAVYAATRLLSWTPGVMPVGVYRVDSAGDQIIQKQHPVYELLNRRPNRNTTPHVFWEQCQAMILLWGRAICYIERDQAGEVVGLWPIHRRYVDIGRWPNGELAYDISRELDREDNDDYWSKPPTTKRVLAPFEVVDVLNFGGQSVIANAREQLGEAVAAQQYGAGFFAGDAAPAYAIKFERKLDAEAAESFRRKWGQRHGGPKRGVPLLEQGTSIERIGMPNEDAQFLESRQFHVVEIARWFGLPPHKLAELGRATWGNLAEERQNWYESLLPWLTRWHQELHYKLIPAAQQRQTLIKHVVEGVLRADITTRYQAYSIGLDRGFLTLNEVRRKENLNGYGEEGDTPHVPANVTPLGEEPQDGEPSDARGVDGLQTDSEGRAADKVLTEALARLVVKEAAELRSAADKPDRFTDWLDTFYGRKWPDKLRAQLKPTMAALDSLGRSVDLDAWVDGWCQRSQAEVLELAGRATPKQLSHLVDAYCDGLTRSTHTEPSDD
jgi:HK97 family phage portal protein